MTQQSAYGQSRHRVRFTCTAVGAIILFFLSPFFTNSSAHAEVVINELLPKTEPATLEWVELYNTGSQPVSLDRWRLQNSEGIVKTFILNASWIIAPHGFLTFTGSQTGISFSIAKDGDTVRLFDEKNNQVDSQTYPSILGYNTSMGRSSDGDGTWTMCTMPTNNMTNRCPQPSPTSTPLPTSTPKPTPKPLPTKTPPPTRTPTPARQSFGSYLPSPTETQVLGAIDNPSPTPTPDSTSLTLKIDKTFASQILLIAIAFGVIAGVAYVLLLYKKGIA